MSNPLISVVMPAYNHEKYVGKAIESVLDQTFEDFEFIIIDDGSTDETHSVISTYNDPRIKYLRQENKGACNTINRGISVAKGKYISIINSDDLYHPERLDYLIKHAQNHNSIFIFTNLSFINNNGKRIREEANWQRELQAKYAECGSLKQTFLSGNIAATTSNFFFHSDLVKEIGSFKPYRYVHDYDFIFRVLFKYPHRIHYIDDRKYVFYRFHGENTVRESMAELNIEILKLMFEKTFDLIQNKENRVLIEAGLKHIEQLNKSMFPEMRQREVVNKEITDTMSWKITSPLRWAYNKYLKLKY